MMKIKFYLILFMCALSLDISLNAVSYGSDTTTSIVNPFNITGGNNIINTFGCAKNGFALAEPTVSCSFNSIFPVAGPISFRGGTLWLQSDLILTNTGSFADLGRIKGQQHALDLPESVRSFAYGTQPNGALVLNLTARVTANRDIYSSGWSYDGKYVAITVTSGPGNELFVYEFTGAALTLRASYNLGGTGNSVRWRPNSYYIAVATTNTGGKIRTFLFNTSPAYSLTLISTQNPTGTYYAVAWQGRGNYLAAGGTSLGVYTVSAGGTMSSLVTPTNNASFSTSYVNFDCLNWAPTGNKDDLIVGTSGGNFHLYNFTGAALNHLKNYPQGTEIDSLDWAPTSTYMALGFSNGNVKTYQHTAESNAIGLKTTYAGIGTLVESISWKPNGTELAIGCDYTAAGDEFQVLSFNKSTYALTNLYNINLTTNVYSVRYSPNGTYIARGDPATRYLSIYKESYSTFIFKDIKLYLTGNVTLGSPLTFQGDCILNARNNLITFTGDGSLSIAQNSTLLVEQTYLNFTTPNTFALQGGNSNVTFRNSWIELDADVLWGDGKFDSYEDLVVTGPYTFNYASAYTSTIHSNSNLTVQKGAELQIGKTTLEARDPLAFEDNAAQLTFDNATFHVTDSGLKLTKGIINVYNETDFIIDNLDNTQSCSLILGDSSKGSTYDVGLRLYGNGTALHCQNGPIILNSVSPFMNEFLGQSHIYLENYCSVGINRPIDVGAGWFSADETANLIFSPSAYMLCNKARFTNDVDTDRHEDYYLTGTLNAVQPMNLYENSILSLNTGVLLQIINVIGVGNQITGLGRIQGLLNFTDSNSELTWDLASMLEFYADISLNGGRIIFTNDSGLINSLTFKTTGTVDLTNTNFYIGPAPTTWDGDIYWVGEGGNLMLQEDVSLSGVWTFSGRITLSGYNKTLILENGGRFVLERGAQVTFKDLLIDNLSKDNPIVCMDDNCKITFDYSDIALGGDYSFNKGSFTIYNDTWITSLGGFDTFYTFSYESTQTSTIDEMCYLKVGPRTRFTIGRKNSSITDPEQQPLVFVDATSPLILADGTLHITSSGMILTKGELNIQGDSHLEIENSKCDYALIFGDGENGGNDHALAINAGARVSVESGKLVYNNCTENKINFGSAESTLNLVAQKSLVGLRSLRLENGTITTPNPTDVIIPYNPDIFVIGTNLHRYDYAHLIDYYVTGTLSAVGGEPTIILDSGGQIVTNPGVIPIDLYIIGGGNRISGLGNFTGSINFTDHTSTLTWDINQIFSGGNINLNGGKIIYTQDSGFDGQYSFVGTGTIDLTSHFFNVGPDGPTWPGNFYWIGDGGTILIDSDITIDGTWTLSGNVILTGDYTIDLSPSGRIELERGAQVTIQGISLWNLSRNNPIVCLDDNCLITLNYVDFMMLNDFVFDKGGLYIYWNSTIGTLGPLDTKLTFSYTSAVSSLIDAYANLTIQPGTVFSIGRKDSTITDPDLQPLTFVDATSQLILDGSTLHITSSGMLMNKGKLIVQSGSTLETENNKLDYGLILGDGALENDQLLEIRAGGELKLTTGKLVYNNAANNRIVFDSPASILAVENTYGVYAQRDMYLENGSVTTPENINFLNYDPGVFVTASNLNRYDYSHLLDYYLTGTLALLPTRSVVLDSNDQVLLNPGTFPISVFVEKTGNRVSGVGNIAAPITLTNSNSELTWDINGKYVGDSFDLNGGKIVLSQDSGLIGQTSFVGTGTVDLSSHIFDLGVEDATWNGDLYWIGDGGILSVNSNVTLNGTWTFSGNVVIEGNNFLIDLAPSGKIVLERGATLSLKNISMYDVSNTNPIVCSDDNCIVTMSIADILMSGDYIFDKGSIFVYWNSTIGQLGDLDAKYTFSYTSAVSSRIDTFASLKIWPRTIFSIGRKDSTIVDPEAQPLKFGDSTSKLILDSSTLHVTSSGMILTKGEIDVTGGSVLEVENDKIEYGLILGYGTVENDQMLRLDAGGQLTLRTGRLVYNNAANDRIVFDSSTSTIAVEKQYGFYTNRYLVLADGSFAAPADVVFLYPAKPVQVSNLHRYDYGHTLDYYATGTFALLPSRTVILDTNDQVLINPGTFPLSIVVTHTGNRISGVGNVTGALNFVDSSSTLTWDISSRYLGGNINLNGGRIIYTQDSGLIDGGSIVGTGTIDLNSHVLDLGTEYLTWHGDLYWAGNGGTIRLNNDIILDGTWTLSGNIIIDGGYTIDLSPSGKIILERGAQVTIDNSSIYNLSRKNPIVCLDDNCLITMNYMDLLMGGDYEFDKGSLYVYWDSTIGSLGGADTVYTFSYTSNVGASIDEYSKLQILPGATFAIGRPDSTITDPDLQPITFGPAMSFLELMDRSTLLVTSSGMILTKGNLNIAGHATIKIEGSKDEYGLMFGDGTLENDFICDISGDGILTINQGRIVVNNYQATNRMIFQNPAAEIDLGIGASIKINEDLAIERGYIRLNPGATVETAPGKTFIETDMTEQLMYPYAKYRATGRSSAPYTFTLNDGGYFYTEEGLYGGVLTCNNGTISIGGVAGISDEYGSGPIRLVGPSSTLALSLLAPLKSNILLNGGTLAVKSDAMFVEDRNITGSGVVQIDGRQITFGSQDMHITNTLYWACPTQGKLNLGANTVLSGSWVIDGNMEINGNGNIFDLSRGGILTMRPNSTLVLTNVAMKGVGENFGNIIWNSDNSLLKLSNAYVELENNFSTTLGGIYVDGPTVVGLGNYNWTIDNRASMTIDGVTLWQDTLDQDLPGSGRIVFGSGDQSQYLSLVSSGTIKTAADASTLEIAIDEVGADVQKQLNTLDRGPANIHFIQDAIYTLTYNLNLSPLHFLHVAANTTINGNGFAINLSGNSGDQIIVDANKTVILENATINNFSESAFNIGSNSNLIFGDGVYIFLDSAQQIVNSWLFAGDVIMGNGNLGIDLSGGNLIVQSGGNLTLQDVFVYGMKTNNIRCQGDNATLTVKNSGLILSNNYSFTSGKIRFMGDVNISGTNTFVYKPTNSSSGIAQNSTLLLDLGITFSYAPSTSSRDLLGMDDQTACLYLNGCTLGSTTTGMRLTKGTLIVDYKNYFVNDGATSISQGICFGDGTIDNDLHINILSGGSINMLSGKLVYANVG